MATSTSPAPSAMSILSGVNVLRAVGTGIVTSPSGYVTRGVPTVRTGTPVPTH